MPFVQSIDNARAENIGSDGIAAAAFDAALGRTKPALRWLRERYADGALALLRVPERSDDLGGLAATADRLAAGAAHVVFLGTGGSSLGGQMLAQLAGYGVAGLRPPPGRPRLHFLDNLDPDTLGRLLAELPLAQSRFVAVSKSGGTAETLMQAAAVLAALEEAGLQSRIPELVLGLSEPRPSGRRNGLRDLLARYGVPVLDHDPGIGGRFSVLTNVGLLPAAIAGIDIAAVRAGAATVLARALDGSSPDAVPPAVGAALSIALAERMDKPIAVMMAYADRLERFTRWWVQLWAESLGKDGRGSTPLAALGPVDQHSQLQLFIAGPRDKLFTLITHAAAGQGPRIAPALARDAGEPDFAGRTVGDLVAAQGRATAETLARNGRPVRTIHLARLDGQSIGALAMHFMLETIIAAHLLGVDAFDQPAVEEGKVLAKRYLTGAV